MCLELPKQEPMKQRFKKGRFWRFSPDDIHFRDDPDDIGRDIRTLGYKPHSHPWGRKPYWRKKRREIRRYRAKMKVTHNGMIMEGTPEEIAQLIKLIEANQKPVQMESKPVVIVASPFVTEMIRMQAAKEAANAHQ